MSLPHDVLSSKQAGNLREKITKADKAQLVEFVKQLDSLRSFAIERVFTLAKESLYATG